MAGAQPGGHCTAAAESSVCHRVKDLLLGVIEETVANTVNTLKDGRAAGQRQAPSKYKPPDCSAEPSGTVSAAFSSLRINVTSYLDQASTRPLPAAADDGSGSRIGRARSPAAASASEWRYYVASHNGDACSPADRRPHPVRRSPVLIYCLLHGGRRTCGWTGAMPAE